MLKSISHSFAVVIREISTGKLEDKIRIHVRVCNILFINRVRGLNRKLQSSKWPIREHEFSRPYNKMLVLHHSPVGFVNISGCHILIILSHPNVEKKLWSVRSNILFDLYSSLYFSYSFFIRCYQVFQRYFYFAKLRTTTK